MTEEQKLKTHQIIRDCDRILGYLATLPSEVRVQQWKGSILDCKKIMVGFLFDDLSDQTDEFVSERIQEDDAKLRGEQPQ